MTMLIDDSILFDLLLGNPQALEWLVIQRDLSISVLSLAAIQSECRPWETHQLQPWLEGFQWLPVDASIAAAAGALSQQSPLPLHEAVLLATARAHGLRLATVRTKRFPLSLRDVVHAYQRNTSPAASS